MEPATLMEQSDFPLVPKELLDELARIYADRCPTLDMSDREVWMAVGAAAVVRKLRTEFNNQNAENRIIG